MYLWEDIIKTAHTKPKSPPGLLVRKNMPESIRVKSPNTIWIFWGVRGVDQGGGVVMGGQIFFKFRVKNKFGDFWFGGVWGSHDPIFFGMNHLVGLK